MTTSAEQTEAVLGHHMQTFGATDLDGIMSDYTESSVVIAPDRTYRGLEEIRSFFAGMFPMVTPEFMAAFKMIKQEVSEDIAYVAWSVDGFFALGTDTLVVRDGKIAVQTVASHPAS